MLDQIKNIHFIGIGGVGMSALAYVLIKRGYHVTGSDAKAGYMANKLADEGAVVFIGHAACQVEGAEAVVISTAISQDNPELVEAKKRQIPILHRSDVLAYLINKNKGIAVAGAHGKTTTSSMLACICSAAQLDPTVVVGGLVKNLGGNALNGQGDLVVAEADESDGSFLKFHPFIEVITNIENDHLDHYGSEEKIQEAFAEFTRNMKDGGSVVLCFDNAKVRSLVKNKEKHVITYGIDCPTADYVAKHIDYQANGTLFDVYYKDEFLAQARLQIPGKHNVLNALGAIAASRILGIELASILQTLSIFTGAARRFETKGKVNGIWVVDDYAHHPTEIKATLVAAKQTKPQRLICAFQPHRYTRTQLLIDEFSTAFVECDELILADIYAASETPLPGITSDYLAQKIHEKTGQQVRVIHSIDGIVSYLEQEAQAGDLIITMGAGDIYLAGDRLVKKLNGREKMTKERIAVVMGGPSKEAEISMLTGNAILTALLEKGYDAVALELNPEHFVEELRATGATMVFNAVHGLYGEDGRLQSVLEMLNMPYTGSGVLASALSMDKVYTKRIFSEENVSTARYMVVNKRDQATAVEQILAQFTLPLVVKASSQGSSIGVEIVKEAEALPHALEDAFSYGDEILIEEYIKGKEATVVVMMTKDGPQALPVIQIVPHSGAYDFKSKYTKGATDYLVPAPFDEATTKATQAVGVAAYKALGCNGVARTDVMLDEHNVPYALEVNSVPGMTATSLVPKAAAAVGISFPDLCARIVESVKK